MSILATVLGRFGIGHAATKFWASLGLGPTWTGERMSESIALQNAAVWRAIRLTATTCATLPRDLLLRDETGTKVQEGEFYDILQSPNADQTPTEFWEGMFGCVELVGNGFAEKRYVGRRLASLIPLNPHRMEVYRSDQGVLGYRYTDERGRRQEMDADEVFHIKGFSFGADVGLSTLQFAAQSLALSRAAEKTQAKLFGAGLAGAGFLNTGQVLEEPDRKRLTQIMDQYVGSDNAGKLMLLEGGMSYTPVTMPAKDAELLMTRGFQIEEIGRWFDMPPILLGHAAEGQTMWGTGVAEIFQAWYSLGLRARLKRAEEAIAKRLLSPAASRAMKVKFNVDGLLRGNAAAQAALFSAAVQNGWMTRAEVRRLLDLPYIEGTDDLTVQVNLVKLPDLGENVAAEASAKARFRAWLGLEETPALPAPGGAT